MTTDYSILRSHLLEFIRQGIGDRHAQFSLDSLRRFFNSKSITLDADANDWRSIQQIIHEFYIEGIMEVRHGLGRRQRAQLTSLMNTPTTALWSGPLTLPATKVMILMKFAGRLPQITTIPLQNRTLFRLTMDKWSATYLQL